ncbi:hypothetical protein G4Y79_16290 [Phototrophicus methaneseepsis]|uniref:Bacterial transcriptional activator domain-containing protein n=1 Tax=Phototrophicus methaneseepsis TaxID=2710758 RepID=A0A7S8E6K1_9CHLR|nr:BTAD domain-containing putative transcriptional regulator [Phototrophicus methaneseepsis]QPC81259.1 hypothetical protein G4Y79_16290 [Phototrophicus methaneseepsis]
MSVLRIQLLAGRPIVDLDGKNLDIPEASLDLLIYLALENKPSYDRDHLTQVLYESLTDANKESFRKHALHSLSKSVRDLCIKAERTTLSYDGSQVWIDVQEFIALSDVTAEQKTLAARKRVHTSLKQAYDLYQEDFLQDYGLSSKRRGLKPWMQKHYDALRSRFHQLLEKLIQNEITFGNYEAALKYAVRWHESLPTANLPLQYLIWLSAHTQRHTQMLQYWDILTEVELNDSNIIGYPSVGWKQLFDRGVQPELGVLKLDTVARVNIHDLKIWAGGIVIGRDAELETVFEALFTKHTASVLTVSGEQGMGKSEFARAVGFACQRGKLVDRTIYIKMTFKTDFEDLLNTIALKADKSPIVALDYRNKYLSIENLLDEGDYLLVLDQQESGQVFDHEMQSRIKLLSEHVPTIVCTYEAWNDTFDVALQPISSPEIVARIFSKYMEQEKSIGDDVSIHAHRLLNVTQGKPLSLRILASSIRAYKLSIADAIAQVEGTVSENPLMAWCWQLLEGRMKFVLAMILQFDPLEGPQLADLDRMEDRLSKIELELMLKKLGQIGIIDYEEGRYQIHPLTRTYLRALDAQNLPSHESYKEYLRSQFCRIEFGYLEMYSNQFELLDQHYRNILRAFDFCFELDAVGISRINRFVPYLIARGQYYFARRLLSGAETTLSEVDVEMQAELLLNIAKLDVKQGEFEDAGMHLQSALEQAESTQSVSLLAGIHEQLGIIIRKSYPIEQSRRHLEMAKQYARQSGDLSILCTVLANLGSTEIFDNKFDQASVYVEESLELARQVNNPHVELYSVTALGVIRLELVDFEAAFDYFLQAQTLSAQIGNFERQGYINLNLGITSFYLGRFHDARLHLNRASDIAERLQHQELIANIARSMGRVEAAEHYRVRAEASFKRALILSSRLVSSRLAVDFAIDLAKLEFQYHNWADAQRYAKHALDSAVKLDVAFLIAEALYCLSIIVLAQEWIIGPDDTEETVGRLKALLGDQIAQLKDCSITRFHLDRTAFFFQYGLDNFPELHHFRVVDALVELLEID